MPKPLFPNAIRAVFGFILGLIITLIVVGVIRKLVWGLDIYAVPKLTKDWFYNDEGTFMFALLGSALGFLWGAGAVYDFEADAANTDIKALAKPRIPLDPDAPRTIDNPLAALLGAIPAIAYIAVVLVVSIVWLLAVIEFQAIPVGFTVLGLVILGYALGYLMSGDRPQPSMSSLIIIGVLLVIGFGMDVNIVPNLFPSEAVVQTTNSAAQTDEFGTKDFNFVGIIKLENANQSYLFLFFSFFTLFSIVGSAAALALVVYLLNKMVNTAQAETAQPSDGEAFLPIRLVSFFTEWALEVLDGVGAVFRPR